MERLLNFLICLSLSSHVVVSCQASAASSTCTRTSTRTSRTFIASTSSATPNSLSWVCRWIYWRVHCRCPTLGNCYPEAALVLHLWLVRECVCAVLFCCDSRCHSCLVPNVFWYITICPHCCVLHCRNIVLFGRSKTLLGHS